ncbi:unnamed protein product [Protopolystoma xenopodis]|uniref:Uncharacterized protein n=1 Tax=Protopolystoma xenopodis TaxID=117903 RepID=A0A3S5FDV5_9PLAT|nr:unnamed protein product [Protopolystoma xenopodis]
MHKSSNLIMEIVFELQSDKEYYSNVSNTLLYNYVHMHKYLPVCLSEIRMQYLNTDDMEDMIDRIVEIEQNLIGIVARADAVLYRLEYIEVVRRDHRSRMVPLIEGLSQVSHSIIFVNVSVWR